MKISYKHQLNGIGTLVWKQANRFTKNGCRTLFAASKIRFSDIKLKQNNGLKPLYINSFLGPRFFK